MTAIPIAKKVNGRAICRAAACLALLLSPSALFAQGCAMCYQSAAASGERFITALRHGILVLFFPPILIFAGILFAAYRKRDDFAGKKRAAASDYDLDLDQAF